MKVANIGELDANTYSVELQQARNVNNHGKYYYFTDRVMLRQQQPITNYGVIPVKQGEQAKLVLDDPQLKSELELLCERINSGRQANDVFNFKKLDGRQYIKISKLISPPPLQHELMYCIAVNAIFVQANTQQAFLQMQVSEIAYKPISLLTHMWPAAATTTTSPNKSKNDEDFFLDGQIAW